MDYENDPNRNENLRSCSREDSGVTSSVSERKLFRLIAVSFGLLCVLQAALNISLRLTFYGYGNETSNPKTSCKNTSEALLTDFKHYFQQGWVYFHPSFYLISSTKKSWQDSREDCLQRGADLVIINSREEQDFIRKLNRFTWIGLTQRGNSGETWRWVDGTLLTTSYWGPAEPNGHKDRKEECVEIKYHDNENSWNDIHCEHEIFWICEKMVA